MRSSTCLKCSWGLGCDGWARIHYEGIFLSTWDGNGVGLGNHGLSWRFLERRHCRPLQYRAADSIDCFAPAASILLWRERSYENVSRGNQQKSHSKLRQYQHGALSSQRGRNSLFAQFGFSGGNHSSHDPARWPVAATAGNATAVLPAAANDGGHGRPKCRYGRAILRADCDSHDTRACGQRDWFGLSLLW